MNKKEIHDAITKALLNRFKTAELAAKQAHQAATGDESVAENKYDTFGLEASYLAHGQSQRVIECEQDWLLFSKKALHLHRIDHPVTLWTLVELEALNSTLSEKNIFYFALCRRA